jgi:hypothetical protein
MEEDMRFIVAVALAALMSAPVVSFAQDEIPKEFKGFFDDYTQLIKKYPEVSKRFSLQDRKFTSNAENLPNKNVVIRSAGCGHSYCCGHWVDQGGSLFCTACFFCPP